MRDPDRKLRVMTDIDGVLFDFIRLYRDLQRAMGDPPTMSPYWDDYSDTKVWDELWQRPYSLATLRYTLGHAGTWRRLAQLDREHELYFATARSIPGVYEVTKQFLEDNGIREPKLILQPRKDIASLNVGPDYVLEDNLPNAVATAYVDRQALVLLIDQPWNEVDDKVMNIPNLIRLSDVDSAIYNICCWEGIE